MSKQQKNSAFVKMLKEFPKVFGRVSFRERLMLRTAFDYINEEVIADIKANCDLAIEGRDVKIMELEKENAELKKKIGIYQKGMYDEIEKRDKKLTKAIEIIKKLLSCCRNYTQENAEKMEEAEQFLKEIEK